MAGARHGLWISRICIVLLLTTACIGCTTLVPPTRQGSATESTQRCAPAMTKRARAATASRHQDQAASPAPAQSPFSADARRVADVIGVLPVLDKIASRKASREESRLDILILRQRLTDQVLLTLFEVASATAELTCERDRAAQVADRLDALDNARVKRLTIASIVLGGIAGVITGGVGLAAGASTAGDAAEVAGGVFASWFGVSALFIHSEADFRHDRNALQEVWGNPSESTIFSPVIWRFLHNTHTEGMNAPRDEVVDAWRQAGRLGANGSEDEHHRQDLFFGSGGRYGAAELRARSSMLETLEASIRLMHEELEVLLREIVEQTKQTPETAR